MITKTVKELAKIVEGRFIGDGEYSINGVASAETAKANEAAFLLPQYANLLPELNAGVVLMETAPEDTADKNIIVTENPKLAFATLVQLFRPPSRPPVGIHPTAVVAETATIAATASIAAHTFIGEHTFIGDEVVIHPNVTVGAEVHVDAETVLYPGVVVHDRTEIGKRVIIRSNAVIGGEGFGFATDEEKGTHTRIPQIGKVVIGDDVEIGAGTTIDNATFGETSIGRGTKIDNLVHLGHNVRIGENCFIIAQVGIAGSTTVGNHVVLAGQTGVTGHVTIADNVTCGGKTGVVGSLKEPGTYVGYPARPHRQWGRIEGSLTHLPELMKRVKRIEKQLAAEDAEK